MVQEQQVQQEKAAAEAEGLHQNGIKADGGSGSTDPKTKDAVPDSNGNVKDTSSKSPATDKPGKR